MTYGHRRDLIISIQTPNYEILDECSEESLVHVFTSTIFDSIIKCGEQPISKGRTKKDFVKDVNDMVRIDFIPFQNWNRCERFGIPCYISTTCTTLKYLLRSSYVFLFVAKRGRQNASWSATPIIKEQHWSENGMALSWRFRYPRRSNLIVSIWAIFQALNFKQDLCPSQANFTPTSDSTQSSPWENCLDSWLWYWCNKFSTP